MRLFPELHIVEHRYVDGQTRRAKTDNAGASSTCILVDIEVRLQLAMKELMWKVPMTSWIVNSRDLDGFVDTQ